MTITTGLMRTIIAHNVRISPSSHTFLLYYCHRVASFHLQSSPEEAQKKKITAYIIFSEAERPPVLSGVKTK